MERLNTFEIDSFDLKCIIQLLSRRKFKGPLNFVVQWAVEGWGNVSQSFIIEKMSEMPDQLKAVIEGDG